MGRQATRSSPLETGRRFAAAIGAPEPEVIADASHFLQEDQGERIGRRIAELARPRRSRRTDGVTT